MGNSVCARFESDGVVCPPKRLKGVFTTAAVDNIDQNPSSVTAQGAFHGSGSSSDAPGEEREVLSIENQPLKTKCLARPPDSYTAVRPVILPRSEPAVPHLQGSFVRICSGMEEAFSLEYKWLQNIGDELNTQTSHFLIEKISWLEACCYLYFKRRQLQL